MSAAAAAERKRHGFFAGAPTKRGISASMYRPELPSKLGARSDDAQRAAAADSLRSAALAAEPQAVRPLVHHFASRGVRRARVNGVGRTDAERERCALGNRRSSGAGIG